MARREDVPAARVLFGKGPGQALSIHGFPASEMGIPTVECSGDLDGLRFMTPETAEQLADGLRLAARIARGEVLPTPLDQFLEKNKT